MESQERLLCDRLLFVAVLASRSLSFCGLVRSVGFELSLAHGVSSFRLFFLSDNSVGCLPTSGDILFTASEVRPWSAGLHFRRERLNY